MREQRIDLCQTSQKNSEQIHDSIHLFHKNMKQLNTDDRITSMLCAICLFSPDRQELVERNRVEQFQHYYTCVLQNYIQGAKKQNISSFAVSKPLNALDRRCSLLWTVLSYFGVKIID